MTLLRLCHDAVIAAVVLLPIACAPQQRMGMVVDPSTGLQHGSVIETNLLVDASQFADKSIKVTFATRQAIRRSTCMASVRHLKMHIA